MERFPVNPRLNVCKYSTSDSGEKKLHFWCYLRGTSRHSTCPLSVLLMTSQVIFSSSKRLYAGDMLNYRCVNTKEDVAILQRDLHILESWVHKWNMFFSPPKREFLRITNRKDIIHSKYTIQNKYLGVSFNSKPKWSDHIQIICKKG